VLCFSRKLLEDLGVFQGLILDVSKYLPVITSQSNLVYLNRSEAEQDRRYKQLIPYALFFCNDKILRYRRGRGGEEKRLHGLYSVGIGGHISDEDHGLFSEGIGYLDGMRREVREEIAADEVKENTVAVINDDSTDVGYVHFGVVHIMRVDNEAVAGGRSGIVGPEFIPIADATVDLASYESWSRLCLENIGMLLKQATGSPLSSPQQV
jgi:predicted NUDIX family phosphoesterase